MNRKTIIKTKNQMKALMKWRLSFAMLAAFSLASCNSDIFRNLRERWTGYYPVTTMGKDAYVYTQNIGASLTYNFNATRSKYKGTGAGNDEKNRL